MWQLGLKKRFQVELVTNCRHDRDGEEKGFGEGPGVGPVVGGVEVVIVVVFDDK